MKTAIFITVRMKSTRLPKKAILDIEGRKSIEHIIDRMKKSRKIDMIFVCTSSDPNDSVLCDIAKKNSIECFRGSREDKLDRYLNCAKEFGIEFFVTVDGDDILCSYEYVDKIIDKYKETNADVVFCVNLPLGIAPSGIKTSALENVCESKAENDTEVWGGYFTQSNVFKIEYLYASKDEMNDARMTLDYPEDLEFFKMIFKMLNGKSALTDIIKILEKHPEIKEINNKVQKKYEEHLKKAAKPKLK